MTNVGNGFSKQCPVLHVCRSLRNSAISSVSMENYSGFVSLGEHGGRDIVTYPSVHLSRLERRGFHSSLRDQHSGLEVQILALVSYAKREVRPRHN